MASPSQQQHILDMKSQDQLSLPLERLPPSAEEALRAHWRDLVERRLPDAAACSDWPVHRDHCFARILLDNSVGAPWREQIQAPAWRRASPGILSRAIALGEAVLNGEEDLYALNAASLRLRSEV